MTKQFSRVVQGIGVVTVLSLGALAADSKLAAQPITLPASGYAIPQVYVQMGGGNQVSLGQESPQQEPVDWKMSPMHQVGARGKSGAVKGVATFFGGPNIQPSFPILLLPNANSGKTTLTLTQIKERQSVSIPVTVVAAPAGDAARGQVLFKANCVACHGATAQGGIGPNITYTDKGMGGWEIYQFNRAVRIGVDDQGGTLNQTMPRFQISGMGGKEPPTAQQISDIFAYLKTLK